VNSEFKATNITTIPDSTAFEKKKSYQHTVNADKVL